MRTLETLVIRKHATVPYRATSLTFLPVSYVKGRFTPLLEISCESPPDAL